MHSEKENLSYGLPEEIIAARVSRLLNKASVEILSWKTEMISFRSYAPSTRYMLSISGVARTCGRRSKWRMLVKELQRPAGDPFESGWDREVNAYERIVTYVPPTCRLRVPRFLGADRPSHESARLWIEYVEGQPARHWGISTWGTLAAGLANLQSKFLEDCHLFSEPWLNHNDLRQWIETDRANMFPINLNDSTLRLSAPLVDADLMRVVSDLWRERNRFIDRLDSLTQTICHNDIWSGNAVAENIDSPAPRSLIFYWQ